MRISEAPAYLPSNSRAIFSVSSAVISESPYILIVISNRRVSSESFVRSLSEVGVPMPPTLSLNTGSPSMFSNPRPMAS